MTPEPRFLDHHEIGGYLPELDRRGLTGGGFGQLHSATTPFGRAVVAKLCRRVGGSATATVVPEVLHPDLGFIGGADCRHATFSSDHVADVLEGEGRILERAGGGLLPALFDVVADEQGQPVLVMEHLVGAPLSTAAQLAEVLDQLGILASADLLAYHGDLKPEHLFVTDLGAVRALDPAPRFRAEGPGGFTPEYNPLALIGPRADVFAVAVMLYRMAAGVLPYSDARAALQPLSALPPVPPADRGRPQVPATLAAFIDEVLTVDGPSWADSHHEAAANLRVAIGR